MKEQRTWVLIADGASARVLLFHPSGKRLERVAGLEFEGDHRRTSELVQDRQPRTHNSADTRRSAIEGRTDPHRKLKSEFAVRLAEMLHEQWIAAAFDRLVIVAPPVTLGDLRSALSPPVSLRVVAEIGKDLVKTPDIEIASHLGDAL